MMIPLTCMDGTPVDIDAATIRDVQPLGDGCVIYLKEDPPVRVMQSVPWVVALWKAKRT
ncbi:hypothetical protein [Sphingomonas oryzagri]